MGASAQCDLVGLNIGGCLFATTKTTLCSFGPNFFTRLVDGSIPSIKDKEGNFFIDRNGAAFSPLLDYMRTRQLIIPPTLTLDAVLLEADFYSVDLSSAFCGNIRDGPPIQDSILSLYANGRDVLFIERHPHKAHQVILTGMLVLDDTKNKLIREFWRQVCEIKNNAIQCGSCEIMEGESGSIVVRAIIQYSNPLVLPFVSASHNGIPDLKPKTWWEGDKFIDGDYVNMTFMRMDEHEDESEGFRDGEKNTLVASYVVCSDRSGRCQFHPDRFFVVDGQDDAFWVYMPSSDRMATYNQRRPGAKFARGDFQHFTKGWMRFNSQLLNE